MKSEREIKPENEGTYELNTRIAAALNLPHKKELDCQDGSNFGHQYWWDQRSVHIRYQANERLKEVDFTRNMPLLMAYASSFGFEILLSGNKPVVIVSYKGCSDKLEWKEFTGDLLSMVLIDAILEHCRVLEYEHPQFLAHNFQKLM